MKQRFLNILNLLARRSEYMSAINASPYIIEGSNEVSENTFALDIGRSPLAYLSFPGSPFENLKECNDEVYAQFYPPAPESNVFTIRIFHVFAVIKVDGRSIDDIGREFYRLLYRNNVCFAGTGAYIGIDRQGENTLATLNCMLHFLTEWSDDEINQILSFQLAMMFKGLMNSQDISSPMLRRLGR